MNLCLRLAISTLKFIMKRGNKMKIFIYYGNKTEEFSSSKIFVDRLLESLKSDSRFSEVIFRTPSNTDFSHISNWRQVIEFNEERQKISKEMMESDIILLISPVFINNVSSYMKVFLDNFALWTHVMPLVGKVGVPISISSTNGNEFVNDYLTKIMNYWGILTHKSISITLANKKNEGIERYVRYVLHVVDALTCRNFSADTSTLNLFFENNVNNFKLDHENYEKSIFNELPYSKCETFDQAYELMKNKE